MSEEKDMVNACWKWIFSTPECAKELGERPQLLLKDARQVKTNPVRKVFCTGGCYVKIDMRSGGHLKREWKSAELLRGKGVPVVDYMAFGVSPLGEMVVTRALEGSVSVKDWLSEKMCAGVTEEELTPFAENYARFVRSVIDAGVFHPDFHVGNVLYVPGKEQLTLVDVSEVRRRFLFDRWRLWRMVGSVQAFRRVFSRDGMLHLLTLAGAGDAEAMWRKLLKETALHLLHSWPKRSRQMLEGHPRYAVKENGWLRVVDACGRPLECEKTVCEKLSQEEGRKRYLADFFLYLANIPHQRLLAWNKETGELRLEAIDENRVDMVPQELQERFEPLGLRLSPVCWAKNGEGKILLVDCKEVMELPLLVECLNA